MSTTLAATRVLRKRLSSLLAVAALAVTAGMPSSADAQVVTEFSAGITVPAGLGGITAGPNGNLWFTEGGLDRIGRITPDGAVTEFSVGITARSTPANITAGPDGPLSLTRARIGVQFLLRKHGDRE